MGIEVVFRIAGIGIAVAIACQILKQAGRDDIAMITALAGLIIVITMLLSLTGSLFDSIRNIFDLY